MHISSTNELGAVPVSLDHDPALAAQLFAHRAKDASDLLKAVAHEGRLLIVALLAERERSVTELETLLDLRQPAVSQQLARLRADNIVTTRREGKQIFYSLASDAARELVIVVGRLFPAETSTS